MTAAELAALLRAKKRGKGKWVAKCPAHADRRPSLSIAEGRRVPVVLRCQSQGCDTREILAALGLSWGDLFHGAPDAELKGRLADERKLARLDRRFGLVLWMLGLDKAKRNYWLTAARRAGMVRRELREKLDPELKRAREFQEKVKSVGWDAVWAEFLASDKGRSFDEQYGILGPEHGDDGAGVGPVPDAEDIREERIHEASPEL